jgi:hypothetical protein
MQVRNMGRADVMRVTALAGAIVQQGWGAHQNILDNIARNAGAPAMYLGLCQALFQLSQGAPDVMNPIQNALASQNNGLGPGEGLNLINAETQPCWGALLRSPIGNFRALERCGGSNRRREHRREWRDRRPPPQFYSAPLPPPPPRAPFVTPPPRPAYVPSYSPPSQDRWHRGSSQGALDPKNVGDATLFAQRAGNLARAALRGNTGAIQMIQSVRKMAQKGDPIAQHLLPEIAQVLNR